MTFDLDEVSRQTKAQWEKLDRLEKTDVREVREELIRVVAHYDAVASDVKLLWAPVRALEEANKITLEKVARNWLPLLLLLSTVAALVFYRRDEATKLEQRIAKLEVQCKIP